MPALTEFVRGLLYAINLPATFIYLYRSETIVNRCLKCVALNGVIFLGSIFLVQYVLLPTVHAVLHYDVDAGPQTNSVLLLTYNFIGVCFDMLWILPAYIVSFLMNGCWYQDIAEYSYLVKHNASIKPLAKMSAVQVLAVEIYRVVLVGGLVFQHKLMCNFAQLPYVGPVFFVIGFMMLAWLTAFYSFEYVWAINGWRMDKRISHFETNYAYFLGFGTPCALITAFVPFFVSNGLFALVFPMLIILATASKIDVQPADEGSGWMPHRLPILRPIDRLSSKILLSFDKK
eukprot:TRINITY_DN9736_c0_g1_i23.p1 TRINITY_DN9736_c0_g1~~TRINITY_DN9736_c0_g1_i23.p1  ORF type:complete len:288 (-),score=44.89 TRINITY_DN9736_c0_g1_i23:259-1122(-)